MSLKRGTGRTTVDGCLLVSMGLTLGGNIFSPAESVIGTRAGVAMAPVDSSKTTSLQTRRKPKDKKTSSEENKQFDSGGKGEESPPWKADAPVVFSFSGGNLGAGWPLLVSQVLCVSVLCVLFFTIR